MVLNLLASQAWWVVQDQFVGWIWPWSNPVHTGSDPEHQISSAYTSSDPASQSDPLHIRFGPVSQCDCYLVHGVPHRSGNFNGRGAVTAFITLDSAYSLKVEHHCSRPCTIYKKLQSFEQTPLIREWNRRVRDWFVGVLSRSIKGGNW